MQINTQLAKAFNRAVTTAENINNDGSINWDFVDADVYMDLGQNYIAHMGTQLLSDQFNYLADCYTGKITLADRIQIPA